MFINKKSPNLRRALPKTVDQAVANPVEEVKKPTVKKETHKVKNAQQELKAVEGEENKGKGNK